MEDKANELGKRATRAMESLKELNLSGRVYADEVAVITKQGPGLMSSTRKTSYVQFKDGSRALVSEIEGLEIDLRAHKGRSPARKLLVQLAFAAWRGIVGGRPLIAVHSCQGPPFWFRLRDDLHRKVSFGDRELVWEGESLHEVMVLALESAVDAGQDKR